ncbi:DNA-binding protein RFX6 [Holothuria leucospilota]|uniref:DNA-binding protein RFX6 n=1 Tax=Holothuria leucospilota TaxID=206669 RepID=A0A9Q1HFS4_HOLLE|nr:DNA-binding protein RFX6 [Holothuria leucospilota]
MLFINIFLADNSSKIPKAHDTKIGNKRSIKTISSQGTTRKFSLSSKSGTLLPDFPSAKNLKIPKGVTLNEVSQSKILMYMIEFERGMPDHLKGVLQTGLAHDIIGLCDSILHQVLLDVLIPNSISEIPESINIDILHLVQNVLTWMEAALEETPENIRKQKLEAVKEFTRSLRRHTSFLQLAQEGQGDFSERASKFLMLGAHFTSAIIRDMTLKQSSCFGKWSLHA